MPLPADQTLSILPYSRPGDAVQSKPKTAMLVRMSAETLLTLESQPAQTQVHVEFGDKPVRILRCCKERPSKPSAKGNLCR